MTIRAGMGNAVTWSESTFSSHLLTIPGAGLTRRPTGAEGYRAKEAEVTKVLASVTVSRKKCERHSVLAHILLVYTHGAVLKMRAASEAAPKGYKT